MQSICRECRWCLHAWPPARQAGCSISQHSSRCMDHSHMIGAELGCFWASVIEGRWSWGRCRRGCRCCTDRCHQTHGSWHSWWHDHNCVNFWWRWSYSRRGWIGRSDQRSWSDSTSRTLCRCYRSSNLWQRSPPVHRKRCVRNLIKEIICGLFILFIFFYFIDDN